MAKKGKHKGSDNHDDQEKPADLVQSHSKDLSVIGSRSPALLDPLKQYLKEIGQYPLIDIEEEKELALKLRDEGDLGAAKQLVQANLRLVVKIALEYKNAYQNVMDLIQEGNIGLMKAVSKYDPDKGAKLSYYASWWIRSYILKFILDNFRLVKIGTTQAQKKLFYNLMREKERLENQGKDAGPKLLADRLGVKESEVESMQKRLSSSGSELSLDAPVGNEGEYDGSTVMGAFSDESVPADELLASEELRALLMDHLEEFQKELTDRERHILKERMLSELPQTLQEIADRYGISRERARQIENKILDKLKTSLKDYAVD
jgi:RNA polymerase sigma-32 factor